MAISDPRDPVVEADQRVERAKASLRSRIELLERKLGDVRDQLDLPEHIRRHPWPAVGVALALGALAGRGGGGGGGGGAVAAVTALARPRSRSAGRSALVLFGKLAFGLVRELALAQLGLAARRWLEQHAESPEPPPYEGEPIYMGDRYPAP